MKSNIVRFIIFIFLANLIPSQVGVLTPAFGDMFPGWYGVQGKVEVIAFEKLLRDMVSKNFCGKSFVFEFMKSLLPRLK